MIRRPPSSTLFPSRRSSDLIEQPVAARLDVSAVLNVVWRPEVLSGRIITSVEQSVECFKHNCFVLVFQTLFHGDPCHFSPPPAYASSVVTDSLCRRESATPITTQLWIVLQLPLQRCG